MAIGRVRATATSNVYEALSRGDGWKLRAIGMLGRVHRRGSVRAREASEGGSRSPQTQTYIDSGNPTIS